MGPAEWDALSWDHRRMYLEYLDEDPDIPFQIDIPTFTGPEVGAGPSVRENVEIGASVLDLNAMRAELEAARRGRRGGP
jgi:hypothetical protein